MRSLKLLFICFFTLLSINILAHREETYYLHGQVGNIEIALQIDEYGDVCMGRYITPDNKYDEIMEGIISQSGHFELYRYTWEPNYKGRVKRDSVFITETTTDNWSGTWWFEDGRTYAFKMKPINVDELEHPCYRAIKRYDVSPYSAYRTRHVKFKDQVVKKIVKKFKIKNVIDPETGISWFRVVPDKKGVAEVDSINDRLVVEHINAINSSYSCIHMGKSGDFNIGYELHFLNQNLISYTVITNASCYGSPGQDIIQHFTYTLNDAAAVILEDLFWFGSDEKPELTEGEQKWFQYRYKEFGPQILSIMTELYPKKIAPKKTGPCAYDNVNVWQFPNWYLTKKGLYLGAKSPLSNVKCDNPSWALIPYKNLVKYELGDYGLK